MLDAYGRRIHYLRLSVTGQCNLRCRYCMPSGALPCGEEPLTLEELLRLAALSARCGIDTVRITGGEPLVRPGVERLAAGLKAVPGIRKVALTTNGVLLAEQLPALQAAGLDSVNVSLDTLSPEVFARITSRDALPAVLAGIHAVLESGLPLKLNCVPSRGVNEGGVGTAGRAGGRVPAAGAVHRDDAHRLWGRAARPVRAGGAGPAEAPLAGACPPCPGAVCRTGGRPGGLLFCPRLAREHRAHRRGTRQVLRFLQPGAAHQSGFSAALPRQRGRVRPAGPCCGAALRTKNFWPPLPRPSGQSPGNIILKQRGISPFPGNVPHRRIDTMGKLLAICTSPGGAPSRPRWRAPF